jgi:hypothetical protein
MNDVRFPETRQDHPRKVAAGDHGVARVASELVISGTQGGIENERWQLDHAHAHAAQTRPGCGYQGIPRTTTDKLRVDHQGPFGVSGTHRRVGGDCENMEKIRERLKKFCPLLCITKCLETTEPGSLQ